MSGGVRIGLVQSACTGARDRNIAQALDGSLFVTLGDHYFPRKDAQSLANHIGKIVRVRKDGTVPPDNPFVGHDGAKPEIWSKPADWQKAVDTHKAETAKLKQVAAAGDLSAIKAQFGAVQKTCKACHDAFRKD